MNWYLPDGPVPCVWGDFNACGWGGDGDESFYGLDREALAAITVIEGMQVFVWTEDEEDTILGCVAILQHVTLGSFIGWRAQPVPGTFYRGPRPDRMTAAGR